ncbi:MAG: hypothetical protein II045_03075, partial [Oscillospiraceae bacterium]|nr:hypothetical protein [Oscillospiraceae bacterium]
MPCTVTTAAKTAITAITCRKSLSDVAVCGFNLRDIRTKDIPMLRRRLGVVFQDFQLLMDRSV